MNDEEYPVIGFGIEYVNELVYCEAVMKHNFYDILFDANWVGSIEHTEDMEWIQASGKLLPQDIIDEIGYRIEGNYK